MIRFVPESQLELFNGPAFIAQSMKSDAKIVVRCAETWSGSRNDPELLDRVVPSAKLQERVGVVVSDFRVVFENRYIVRKRPFHFTTIIIAIDERKASSNGVRIPRSRTRSGVRKRPALLSTVVRSPFRK